ncbi:MAG: putative DNA-binding domain-containing protein [Planctomycetaceae bacterium]
MAIPNPRDLDQVQQWMQNVIMHPDGVTAGLGSEAARRHIDVPPEGVQHVIRPSRRQTSIERLQVYANAYYARLLECLREEFPALLHALGPETFDAFAFGYLQAYPSTSYTLANLGRSFPRYLHETRPVDTVSNDGVPSWPDFLIDLATLERTYSEVFDGPGAESTRTLPLEELTAIPMEQWPAARLVPVPCLRLLVLRFPVHEYSSAVRQRAEPKLPPPEPTYLVVTRRDFVVRRTAVTRTAFELLSALVREESVGAAIECAAAAPEVDVDVLANDLRQWFRSWAAAGYFLAVQLPG